VPLGAGAPTTELRLPLDARMDSSERVLVDLLADGRVVALRVVQRLTLTGTGDYFFLVPAPLRDVSGASGTQAEPGFRRNAIIWQGFANRKRVLAADAELDVARARDALPLRLELTATVDGRRLGRDALRDGRLALALTLRNTTAVGTKIFAAAARPGAVRRVVSRVAAQARSGALPEQPVVEVEGPIRLRPVTIDAPLIVRGELRVPVRRLDDAVVHGGTLVRREGAVAVRFGLVLGGSRPPSSTIRLTGVARAAGFPRVSLSAEPSAAAVETAAPAGGNGRDAIVAAGRSLLELARVRQYDAFLANPAAGGSVQAVYRFRTVEPTSVSAPVRAHGDDGISRAVVLLLAIAGAGGLAVLWAHL
jgi:hypothetical protein